MSSVAYAAELPKMTGRITDTTGTLTTQQIQNINRFSSSIENSFSHKPEIIAVISTSELSIEEFANRFLSENNIGKRDKNNGVLLVILTNQRKIRIEVGYGLEPYITDNRAKEVIDSIRPHLRQNQIENSILTYMNRVKQYIPQTLGE